MSNERLHISIVSPEKQLFEGEADSITVPGEAGSFTILVHHAPIVASLKKGTVSYTASGTEQTLDIQGGFVEMSEGVVNVCIY